MLLGAWLGLRMWHRAKLREFAQQKRILRQENELDAMRRKEEHLRTTFFRQLNSRFIAQVRQGGESRKCRMSDEDWKTIFTHADAVFDNFTVRLRGQFPALNEEDIRYCCMVRMHLSQAEIASVVCPGKGFGEKTAEAHPHREAGFREGFDAGGNPLAAVKYTPGCRPRRMETAGGQSVEKRPVHCDIPLQTSGNNRGAFNFAHETSPAIRLPQ